MSDIALREEFIESLTEKRIELFGEDAKLELFTRTSSSPLHTLTEGWCPRQQSVGDGHQWDIDIWSLTKPDLQLIEKAKLYAHDEEMTFRVDLNALRFVGGGIFRLGLQVIGDGR